MTKEVHPIEQPPIMHYGVISDGRLYYGFARTQRFFERALELEVDKMVLRKPQSFERNLSVTKTYLLSDQTLQEVGYQFGFTTREGVRKVVRKTLALLVQSSPDELRRVFLQDDLDVTKPRTLESRINQSIRQGGITREVQKLILEGRTVQEIQEILNVTGTSLADARKTLSMWGPTELPYIRSGIQLRPILEAKLQDRAADDTEISSLLSKVHHRFYESHSQGEYPLLIPVYRLIRELGFHVRAQLTSTFVTKLQIKGLPTGTLHFTLKSGKHKGMKVTYYFIASIHKERAVKILAEAEDLQGYKENPVKQVFGPKVEDLPNTTLLKNGRGFNLTKLALARLDIKYSSALIHNLIGPDCPIPILRHGSNLYYREEDLQEFTDYLRSKL